MTPQEIRKLRIKRVLVNILASIFAIASVILITVVMTIPATIYKIYTEIKYIWTDAITIGNMGIYNDVTDRFLSLFYI